MQKLLSSSAKMASATFISRILGLVREQMMAAYFGATGTTDAFNVAYRIPNLLRDLFAEGAFSSAFVPIFTDVKIKQSPEQARRLFASCLLLLLFATGVMVCLIWLFAPQIVAWFAPSYSSQPDKYQLTINLVRIMAPFLTFVSLAALVMGVLNTLKVFFISALAPACFNLCMIASIYFLPHILVQNNYLPIYSLGIGVFIGGLVQLFIQVPKLLSLGFSPLKPTQIFSKATKQILSRMSIGLLGIAGNQVNLLVSTILATSTVEGAVSWLFYAFRLFQFPLGVLGVSIGGSNLVHFSEKWRADLKDEARSIYTTSYHLSLFIMLPAAILLFVFAEHYIAVIFERGAFLPSDTISSGAALKLYALGLPFYGLYKISAPTFFAIDKPKLSVYISLVGIGLNLIFCLWATPKYGFTMLALGTSLIMFFNSLFQNIYLKRELGLQLNDFISVKFFKILLVGLVMFLILVWLKLNFLDRGDSWLIYAGQVSLISLSGLGLYALLSYLLGVPQALGMHFNKK